MASRVNKIQYLSVCLSACLPVSVSGLLSLSLFPVQHCTSLLDGAVARRLEETFTKLRAKLAKDM